MNIKEYRKHILAIYRQSDQWQKIRLLKIGRAGGFCEWCGSAESLQCHHLNYDYLGHEYDQPGCLKVLCKSCHEAVEKKKDNVKL